MKRAAALMAVAVSCLCMLGFSECRAQSGSAVRAPRPLVIYYSLTGTTRILAQEIARELGCDMLELKSERSRTGFWKVNCVFDQLLDREDDLAPVTKALDLYNPIIIAAPIWIHRYASPMRTFLKQAHLKGKDVYAIAAHRGNYREQDGQGIMRLLASRCRCLKGYMAICTKEKDPQQLQEELRSGLQQTDLLMKGAPRNRG
jgi:multimeric flavodoxin WrbA